MNKTPGAIVKWSQLVSGADSVNTYTGVNLLNQEMFLDNKTNCLFAWGFWILWDCSRRKSVAIEGKVCLTSFFIQVVHDGMSALIWKWEDQRATFINNLSNITENYYAICKASFTLDCKTVRIFAYSSRREHSNKRSGARLKTKSEMGRDALQACEACTLRAWDFYATLNRRVWRKNRPFWSLRLHHTRRTFFLLKNFTGEFVYLEPFNIFNHLHETDKPGQGLTFVSGFTNLCIYNVDCQQSCNEAARRAGQIFDRTG